jgi:PhnB protein
MSTSSQTSIRREARTATRVTPYLRFNGNCREAMMFYKDCFGGDLTVMTVAESPEASKMKGEDPKHVFHSSLTSGGIELMGSDLAPEQGLSKGNTMALALQCSSEEELRQFFSKLSSGGKTDYAPAQTTWGAIYGQLVDKFRNEWMLTFMNR